MKKKDFYWVWKDSPRENIINQFYYEHESLMLANKTIAKVIEYINLNKLETTGDLDHFDVKIILHFLQQYYESEK